MRAGASHGPGGDVRQTSIESSEISYEQEDSDPSPAVAVTTTSSVAGVGVPARTAGSRYAVAGGTETGPRGWPPISQRTSTGIPWPSAEKRTASSST
jgi:hypothetical protein